jgi:DNA-binding CsgD family transcriptional regulator
MARLQNADLARALRVVQTVAEARDPDEFARVVPSRLAELVPSDVIVLNEVDLAEGRTMYVAEPESFVVPPELEQRLIELSDEHPLIHYYMTTGDGSAKRISDFWTQAEFHASRIYKLLYQLLGVEYQIALTLPAPRPIVVAIVASRSDKDFSERDRSVLNLLRPHLIQSWYNVRDQHHLRSLLSVASAATEDSGAEVVVLSDPPHELTPGALVSLYRHFGPPTPAGPLPPRVDRWIGAQRSRLADSDSLELLKPLRGGSGGQRVVLRYLPAQEDHPGALLLRAEASTPRRQSLESLGLTPREAQIVQCLISGETNAAIGGSLHVSTGTVKKHLDNIYAKLGVRGRGRLTAFVLDVLERPVL